MLSRLLFAATGGALGVVCTGASQRAKLDTIGTIVDSYSVDVPNDITAAKYKAIKSMLFIELHDNMVTKLSLNQMVIRNRAIVEAGIKNIVGSGTIDCTSIFIKR